MSTPKCDKEVLRRRRKKNVGDLTDLEKFAILQDYKTGQFTPVQITDKYRLKDTEAVREWIGRTIKELNIVQETAQLAASTTKIPEQYKPNDLINQPFLDKLSPPDPSNELTQAEFSYIYTLVFTGDHKAAIKDSGLDVGLKKYKSDDTSAYSHALKMRGIFLRQKPNIKVKIEELRAKKFKELGKDISKQWVVSELVDQLDRLKESGEHPKLILDCIDKIGKTCGAFTDHVEVTTVSASSKLDQLIEMAKQEVIPLKPHQITTETWEAESE